MRIAVLIVSKNRPDLVRGQVAWLGRNSSLDHDVYVVENGTDDDQLCEHSTIRCADGDSRGRTYALNVALEHARKAAREGGFTYDHHWVLANDVTFEEGVDAMRILAEQMEAEPRIGVLSPTCRDGRYPGSARRPGGGCRAVTTCDDAGFMIRGEVVETIGFPSPDFRYDQGAMHELSFLLYSKGYCVAYSDDVESRRIDGMNGADTMPREEFERRAKRFAFTYFNRVYGADWARVFAERAAPFGPEIDTYSEHEALWMTALEPDEIAHLKGATTVTPAAAAPDDAGTAAPEADGALPPQMTKVLAWPRYDDEAALERFFRAFAGVLEGREDVMLFLRVDPRHDPSQADVIAALERVHAKTLGAEALLNVQLLEGPISEAEWRAMGPLLACRIRTGDEDAPRDGVRLVPTPVVTDTNGLRAILSGSSYVATAPRPAAQAPTAKGSGHDLTVSAG